MVHRVLVVRAGAVGDVLLTLPALHSLRQQYPSAHITVVGYPHLWEVAGGLIDEVHSIDDPIWAGLFGAPMSPALLTRLQRADLLVAWTVRAPTGEVVSAVRTVHATPYPPPGIHASAWLASTLGESPADPSSGPPAVPPNILGLTPAELTETRSAVTGLVGSADPIVIHPGAGAAWKRWPPDRFAALIHALSPDRPIALVEGLADAEPVTAIQTAVERPVPVIRETSLRRLAAFLSHASLYIGNDSGITHLAALASAPTIALFGPTDPASWAPLGIVRIVRRCFATTSRQGEIRVCDSHPCMEAIPLEDVMTAIHDTRINP